MIYSVHDYTRQEFFIIIVRPQIRGAGQIMSLKDSIQNTEGALIKSLQAKRSAIDDRTGKGVATELLIERVLLRPYMPTGFSCLKGSVVTASAPDSQSPAIDRIIYDLSAAPPLVYEESHSIFPIESVCGLIEITMSLDANKLREDIERMSPIKAMRKRRYIMPVPNSKTKVLRVEQEALSPRSFIVGLPADPSWNPKTIAQALRKIQLELGPPTHVHGLYVLGIGLFVTVAVESTVEPMYRINAWTGTDRLFRFTDSLRHSLDRWGRLPTGWSYDLQDYINGQSEILAE